MNHLIICIFFAITIFLCNAAEDASIAKPFLPSPTQFLPSALEEPDVRKGRKKPPPPPRSPPPPPPLLEFNHFKLAETWPPTFCKINTCIDDYRPMKFIIHGLWPGDLTDCDPDKKMKPDYEKLSGIYPKLIEDWPNLHKVKNKFPVETNKELWFFEWYKHGTCSAQLFTFPEYMGMAIQLYGNKHNIVLILRNAGIKPGGKYSRDEISDAISKHIKFTPQIQCKKIGQISYLLEVRFCFTASKDPQYINCDGHGSLFGQECDAEVHF
ncbi:ribonuclease S-F11 [Medicago truncatula]|nr:ribonuclease S-F11 [Medicago truncatula]